MIDWLMKTLVNSYSYSNINDDRKCKKSVRINGRLYDKYGVDCATTIVALVYKVYSPSINNINYVVSFGIARQNPCDNILDKETGEEIATENAMFNPIMVTKYNDMPEEYTIDMLMRSYISGLPIQFVKTRQEILEEGKDLSQYNRNIRNNNDSYQEYYKDFKNIFYE